MKIQGPDRSQKSSSSKKSGKAGSSGDGFGVFLKESDVSGASSTSQSQSINSVEALLAAQAAEDPTERAARNRMRERADDILAELEGLHMRLLNGNMTVGHLLNLADIASSHREKINDPRLTEILDQIDLRAQIEIAKMRISMDNVV